MTGNYFSLSPPRFCPTCGGHLTERLLETEDRPRLVCVLFLVTALILLSTLLRRGRSDYLHFGLGAPKTGPAGDLWEDNK
jgi:hypothetical protein